MKKISTAEPDTARFEDTDFGILCALVNMVATEYGEDATSAQIIAYKNEIFRGCLLTSMSTLDWGVVFNLANRKRRLLQSKKSVELSK